MRDSSVRRWSAFHTFVYRLTGGLVGGRLIGNDMLLLTTRGHVTGRAHTVPLLYLRERRTLVVIASYGGRPDPPTWYRNLLADPRVVVRVRHRRREVTARTADPSERAVWWPRIVAAHETYATYQSRTDREIPVVFLEPREEG